ncbi:uncharacterized protein LOC134709938 [Mytilus trossulus]|uniref:uncharacterized protein LOC134709938 n=1 Tax=Mytilus trossulus TaxID=6551 RepID=UPI003006A1D7
MELKKIVLCDPCKYDDTTKSAKKWCTYCEEGFCVDCEKVHRSTKISRDHRLISVDDYENRYDLISVNLNCGIHCKRLELYCIKHNEEICVACITSNHKGCRDIMLIENVAKIAKCSTSLNDLFTIMSKMLNNVECCIKDREMLTSKIDEEEQFIKKTIYDTRMSLNKRLDELEQNLLIELKSKYETSKAKIKSSLKNLELVKTELENISKMAVQLTEFASDLQIFLATRQKATKLEKISKGINDNLRLENNFSFKIELHPMILTLQKDIKQFGEIKLTEQNAGLQFQDEKIDQAQKRIHELKLDFHGKNLQLKTTFDLKHVEYSITGCILLPDERIIAAVSDLKKSLQEYNMISGENIRDIPVSGSPFDLTTIDTHRIAVTYGYGKFIEVINMQTNAVTVEKKINCDGNCWGISYQDGKLYVAVCKKGILVTNTSGNILNTIRCNPHYITTTYDSIYYTNGSRDTVNCCTMTGQEIWNFTDTLTDELEGISVDHVLVVCRMWNSLKLIQRDGKDSKTLLTMVDGLNHPSVVCYNKDLKLM